jgi:hypothetical protein
MENAGAPIATSYALRQEDATKLTAAWRVAMAATARKTTLMNASVMVEIARKSIAIPANVTVEVATKPDVMEAAPEAIVLEAVTA